jgi:hypothetical protein
MFIVCALVIPNATSGSNQQIKAAGSSPAFILSTTPHGVPLSENPKSNTFVRLDG